MLLEYVYQHINYTNEVFFFANINFCKLMSDEQRPIFRSLILVLVLVLVLVEHTSRHLMTLNKGVINRKVQGEVQVQVRVTGISANI